AGYSGLMALNEVSTIQALVRRREIFAGAIASFQGRIVNVAGDSILAEFSSVVGAAEAALAAQSLIDEGNRLEPQLSAMLFRIGIHMGEVITESADVFGDGINTAARLQSIAEPGGVMVSESVYHNIATKRQITAVFEGTRVLKGLSNPVVIYS